jgi:pilus assembly protein Flp/PilA
MRQFLKSLRRDERGVTALEYAILAGIIVAAVAGIGVSFGSNLSTVFTTLTNKVNSAVSSSS